MKQIIAIASVLFSLQIEASPSDRELFSAFYPPPFVEVTLNRFSVSESEHSAIIDTLKQSELEVVTRVETVAEKMDPNPLQSGDQRQIIKLFDQSVAAVFTDVMYRNGVYDDKQISEMIEDIYRQKTERFRACMEASPNQFVR